MATRYSVQTKRSDPLVQDYTLRSGMSEVNANASIAFFSRFSTDAVDGDLAEDDVVLMARLPKGARIIGGEIKRSALGASVTLIAGYLGVAAGSAYTDDDAFLASFDAAAAGTSPLAETIALNFGLVLTEESWLTVTVAGASPDASQSIQGYIKYLTN